jgi:predicted TIM-barrel fold metal-dependent hydrolase
VLLKDYRPCSIYNLPQTQIEKARYPVIDVHAHPQATNEADVDRFVRVMDAVGIERTILLTGRTGSKFDETVARYNKYPQRFELWCGIDFHGFDQPGFGPAAIAELERCRKAGAKGVGELSDKGGGLVHNAGGMHMDDPRMDPILEKCTELGLPINIHVGEDLWMYRPMDQSNDGLMNAYRWRIPENPAVLRHDEVVATLDRAVRKHPRTVFIACHFANCCSDLNKLGAMLDRYPNLYADTGARFAEIAPIPRFVAKFCARYSDRLLYGTDMYVDAGMYRETFRILESEDEHFYPVYFRAYHWALNGLGLPDAVLKKVYRENASKILGTPKTP